eukprot:jgi/Mesvir1/713/Mv17325-RA.4
MLSTLCAGQFPRTAKTLDWAPWNPSHPSASITPGVAAGSADPSNTNSNTNGNTNTHSDSNSNRGRGHPLVGGAHDPSPGARRYPHHAPSSGSGPIACWRTRSSRRRGNSNNSSNSKGESDSRHSNSNNSQAPSSRTVVGGAVVPGSDPQGQLAQATARSHGQASPAPPAIVSPHRLGRGDSPNHYDNSHQRTCMAAMAMGAGAGAADASINTGGHVAGAPPPPGPGLMPSDFGMSPLHSPLVAGTPHNRGHGDVSAIKQPRMLADATSPSSSSAVCTLELSDLPDEMLLALVTALDDPADLARVGALSRRFRQLVLWDDHWMALYHARWGPLCAVAVRAAELAGSWRALYASKHVTERRAQPWAQLCAHELGVVVEAIAGPPPRAHAASVVASQHLAAVTSLSPSPTTTTPPTSAGAADVSPPASAVEARASAVAGAGIHRQKQKEPAVEPSPLEGPTHAQAAQPPCPPGTPPGGYKGLAVIFVVDGSGSVMGEDFGAMTSFLRDAGTLIKRDHPDAVLGVIQFSNDLRVELHPSNMPLDAFQLGVNSIMRMNGGTNMALPLRKAESLLMEECGGKDGARCCVVVLTDGRMDSYQAREAVQRAEQLRGRGIALFALGVGKGVDAAELTSMVVTAGGVDADRLRCHACGGCKHAGLIVSAAAATATALPAGPRRAPVVDALPAAMASRTPSVSRGGAAGSGQDQAGDPAGCSAVAAGAAVVCTGGNGKPRDASRSLARVSVASSPLLSSAGSSPTSSAFTDAGASCPSASCPGASPCGTSLSCGAPLSAAATPVPPLSLPPTSHFPAGSAWDGAVISVALDGGSKGAAGVAGVGGACVDGGACSVQGSSLLRRQVASLARGMYMPLRTLGDDMW